AAGQAEGAMIQPHSQVTSAALVGAQLQHETERGPAAGQAPVLQRGELIPAAGGEDGYRQHRRRGRADPREPPGEPSQPVRGEGGCDPHDQVPGRKPGQPQPRLSPKVRVYRDANGVTDGSIIAAIISAQTATNEPTPSPMVPGIDPISRASTTTPTHATAATASKREASGVSSRRLGPCVITRPTRTKPDGRPCPRGGTAARTPPCATGSPQGPSTGEFPAPSTRPPLAIHARSSCHARPVTSGTLIAQICARPADRTEGTAPVQIESSLRGRTGLRIAGPLMPGPYPDILGGHAR